MDVRCVVCGEPWDISEIGESANEQGMPYKWMAEQFETFGCSALSGRCNESTVGRDSELIAAVYDIMGDDLDGAACAFEDAEMRGIL